MIRCIFICVCVCARTRSYYNTPPSVAEILRVAAVVVCSTDDMENISDRFGTRAAPATDEQRRWYTHEPVVGTVPADREPVPLSRRRGQTARDRRRFCFVVANVPYLYRRRVPISGQYRTGRGDGRLLRLLRLLCRLCRRALGSDRRSGRNMERARTGARGVDCRVT